LKKNKVCYRADWFIRNEKPVGFFYFKYQFSTNCRETERRAVYGIIFIPSADTALTVLAGRKEVMLIGRRGYTKNHCHIH